jgi:hypothetical protein
MSKLTDMTVSHNKKRDSHNVNPSINLKGFKKKEILWLILIIAAYFLLQGVILPKLGIST